MTNLAAALMCAMALGISIERGDSATQAAFLAVFCAANVFFVVRKMVERNQ